MISYLKLESTQYWIESEKQRQESIRRTSTRRPTQRFIGIVTFASCATILALAFAWGVFDNVDVPGTIERIWK
jgi:hypothetical protein